MTRGATGFVGLGPESWPSSTKFHDRVFQGGLPVPYSRKAFLSSRPGAFLQLKIWARTFRIQVVSVAFAGSEAFAAAKIEDNIKGEYSNPTFSIVVSDACRTISALLPHIR